MKLCSGSHDTQSFVCCGRCAVGGSPQGFEDKFKGENCRTFFAMVCGAVVFCPIIGAVGVSGTPVITKLLVGFTAT